MPKTIELTVEIVVQRVSCPGVWLCQNGSVSLIVFALGTSYETCMLPPTFPLEFHDKLYFRKTFQESCALNKICCLLKDETLYCELVQWCQNCEMGECNILAQYLGSLSEVLFPPKMCCNDGVDLLMRRSKKYPGILSPKIEIATKVRIDEVWNDDYKPMHVNIQGNKTINNCSCLPRPGHRQKTVCHSPEYHRSKCSNVGRAPRACSNPRSASRSRSGGSGCSSRSRMPERLHSAPYYDPTCKKRRISPCRGTQRDFCVFNMNVPRDNAWNCATCKGQDIQDNGHGRVARPPQDQQANVNETNKMLLESRYISDDVHNHEYEQLPTERQKCNYKPCVCEICKRYYDLFYEDPDADVS